MSAEDWRVELRCRICGLTSRTSSPLGAWVTGWRDIDWPMKDGVCWYCDREQRRVEVPHESGRRENLSDLSRSR
jgi:hypothetical protein